MKSAVTTFICYCAYAVSVHVPLIQVFPVMIPLSLIWEGLLIVYCIVICM